MIVNVSALEKCVFGFQYKGMGDYPGQNPRIPADIHLKEKNR